MLTTVEIFKYLFSSLLRKSNLKLQKIIRICLRSFLNLRPGFYRIVIKVNWQASIFALVFGIVLRF